MPLSPIVQTMDLSEWGWIMAFNTLAEIMYIEADSPVMMGVITNSSENTTTLVTFQQTN